MLALLLKNKWSIFKNSITLVARTKMRSKVFRYLLLTIWPVILFLNTKELFSAWILMPSMGEQMIVNFISISFLGILVLLLVSGVTLVLHYYFLSSDISLLLSLPLSKKKIFQYKFIEATAANASLFIMLGLPLVLAYGVVVNASIFFYFILIIVTLLFLAIPTALATTISTFIIRILPPQKAKNFTTIFMAGILIFAWAGFQFVKFSALNPAYSDFDPNYMQNFQNVISGSMQRLLPSYWYVKSIHGVAHGDVQEIIYLVALIVVLYSLYFISKRFVEGAYQQDFIGKESMFGFVYVKKNTGMKLKTLSKYTPFFAILQRDQKLLLRDSRVLIQFMFFLAVMVVFPFMVNRMELMDSFLGEYLPFFIIMLIGTWNTCSLAARFLPLERLSFNITKCAPMPARVYLFAKLTLAFVSTLLIFWIAIFFLMTKLQTSFLVFVTIMVMSIFSFLSSASFGLFIASGFSNYKWDNPKRMFFGYGNILLTIGPFTILGIGLAIFTTGLLFFNTFFATLFFCLYTLILSVVGLWVATRKMEKYEWIF